LRIGLNQTDAAESLELAIDKVLSNGFRTCDLDDGKSEIISCSKMGEKIIAEI